jgi:hypothetical protein
LYRQFLASHPGRYTLVDLNRYVSPQGRFADFINGIQMRDDGVHFTHDGALIVDQWLVPQLQEIAQGFDPAAGTETERLDRRKLRAE